MVVQHNLTAMNSNRMLGITQAAQSKSSEKLSSGYRINRAADDAAGLSISEKMRKQIKGLDKAATNAQDGVSAVQTAEGALTEVHSMLQRMNELAVQASNGTNSEDDRAAIQAEIEQLTTEIDRVAETTKFNETYLLKGTDVKTTKTVAAHDAGLAGKLTENTNGTSSFALDKALENGDKITIAGKEYTIGQVKTTSNYMGAKDLADLTMKDGDSFTVNGNTYTLTNKVSVTDLANANPQDGDQITTADRVTYTYDSTYINTNGSTGAWLDANSNEATEKAENALNTTGNIYTAHATGTKHEIVGTYETNKTNEVSTFDLTSFTVADVANAAGLTSIDLTVENGFSANIDNEEITATIDDATSLYTETMTANDSFTVDGTTYTLMDEVIFGTLDNHTFTSGDTFTTNGTTYTYTTAWDNSFDGNFTALNTTGTLTLASGETYNVVADANATENSVSTFNLSDTTVQGVATAAGLDLTTDDLESVSIGGVTTDATYNADTFTNIRSNISGLEGGKTITIADIDGGNAKTYTIANNSDEENIDNDVLTRENIIAKLKEGSTVAYTDNAGNEVKATVAGIDNMGDGITAAQAYKMIAEELTKASSIGTDKAATVVNNNDGTFTINQGSVEVKDALNFNLHVGADADMTNKINVDIESMSAANLGIKGITVADDSGVNATYAIDAIADALAKVSEQRSALGAIQNRLEHTIANLDNVVENTTAAESRIRDTDMAEEMVEYSKNNILAQAGQSMLAQANQSTQGVLSLLG